MAGRKRFHLNVAGEFYVEDGCCLACGVPEDVAPDLFASDPHHYCYVRKQPRSPDELAQMVKVFAMQDLECVRYAGQDPGVMRALRKIGASAACDHPGLAEFAAIVLTGIQRRARRLLHRIRGGAGA